MKVVIPMKLHWIKFSCKHQFFTVLALRMLLSSGRSFACSCCHFYFFFIFIFIYYTVHIVFTFLRRICVAFFLIVAEFFVYSFSANCTLFKDNRPFSFAKYGFTIKNKQNNKYLISAEQSLNIFTSNDKFKKIKSFSMPRVSGAHLRSFALGPTAHFKFISVVNHWQRVGDLIGSGFEPHTSRSTEADVLQLVLSVI